jgi:ATP synthase protein I
LSSPLKRLGIYLELVYTFPVIVGLGAGLGYLADRWLGTEPYLVLVGFVLGLVSAFFYLMKMLQSVKNGDGKGNGDTTT